jgi:hypothetical protein
MVLRITIAVLFVFFTLEFIAQEQGFGVVPHKKYLWFGGSTPAAEKNSIKPVSQAPPFCGKKRRNAGNFLPLPFGAGIHGIFYQQAYEASDLLVYSEEVPLTARADTVYQNTTSGEIKVTVRPDFWLFPFLNVYGIFGYTQGITKPNLRVPYIVVENIPIIGEYIVDTTFEITDELRYVGPTYGAGATVSAGYGSFFVLIDYSYSVTHPNDVEGNLHNHFFSPKVGILLGGKGKKSTGAFWVGTQYISDQHTFTGELLVSDIAPELEIFFGETARYSGTVTSINPWNFVFGGSWFFNDRHHFVLEAGFFERQQISFSYNFRF